MELRQLLVVFGLIVTSYSSPGQCGPRDGVLQQAPTHIRLMKGDSPSTSEGEGRVEVFYEGKFWRRATPEEGEEEEDSTGSDAIVGRSSPKWVEDSIAEGEWGTICNWAFDDRDAKAVCRSLGYANGVHIMAQLVDGVPVPPYGEGAGRIWLEGVDCKGQENDLLECLTEEWKNSGQFGWGKVYYNQHHHDAGVRCSGTGEK